MARSRENPLLRHTGDASRLVTDTGAPQTVRPRPTAELAELAWGKGGAGGQGVSNQRPVRRNRMAVCHCGTTFLVTQVKRPQMTCSQQCGIELRRKLGLHPFNKSKLSESLMAPTEARAIGRGVSRRKASLQGHPPGRDNHDPPARRLSSGVRIVEGPRGDVFMRAGGE